MKEKRNAVITFRTEDWVKDILEKAAEENKWSLAQTVNELCKKFVANPQPEQIIVKAKDLIEAVKQIENTGEEFGVHLLIDLIADTDKMTIQKVLRFDLLECGGMGLREGPEEIKEMTREEIADIP